MAAGAYRAGAATEPRHLCVPTAIGAAPETSTGPGGLERELACPMLLSFERPSAQSGRAPSLRTLKTAQPCQQTGITACSADLLSGVCPSA
jgi:hypothetical protein